MKLNQIADNPGARKKKRRLGRGISSSLPPSPVLAPGVSVVLQESASGACTQNEAEGRWRRQPRNW